jgi:sec-independent protein translocase protein TatC
MPLDQMHEVERFNKANQEMSFFEHISVLRGHILRCFLALAVVTIFVFLQKDFIFNQFLFGPTKADFPTFRILCWLSEKFGLGTSLCIQPVTFKIITRTVGEAFLMHMLTAFWIGLVLVFPYIIYEFWRFIGPGLYENEQKAVRWSVLVCSILFATGTSFGYFIIAPFSINFLMGYDVGIENTTTLESYVDYMVMFTIPMGLIFELPIFCYFLARIGVLTDSFMRKYRRYAIVIIFIIAAIITPSADILTQCLVAFPLWLLYEFSIGVVKKVVKKRELAQLEKKGREVFHGLFFK